MRVAILTVSDSAAAGTRPDGSGPAVAERCRALGWDVVSIEVLSDARAIAMVAGATQRMIAGQALDLGLEGRWDATVAESLDMIAGKNAQFPVEGHSWLRHGELCLDIWRIAAEARAGAFRDRLGERVLDDHIALQNAGIPAIDLIDFSYKHWHRLSDTPENCSAEPMLQVAKVLSTWMQRRK